MRVLRTLALCLFCLGVLASTPSFAQGPAPATAIVDTRIVEKIDDNQLVTLKGNTLPVANSQNDLGPVRSQLPMASLALVLSRSPEQQAAFDEFVAGQYDSSSPNFHHWLLPEQVGEQFGPSLTDIATLSSWLADHGFAVSGVSKDRMTIRFSGTAAQVQSAFHVEIHNLSVRGETHIANMGDPQIPAAIAPLVLGIKGLHNFLPHPLHRVGSKVQFSPDAHGWVRLQNQPGVSLPSQVSGTPSPVARATASPSPRPDYYFPIANAGGAIEEDVAPYDFAAIYNVLPLWNNNITGSGQTISIIGTSDINLNDVSNFKSSFGLPAGNTPVIAHGPDGDPGICTGYTNICNGGDLTENSLDVEWSGAVAPGAQIVLVTGAYNSQTSPTNDPLYDSALWAVDNAGVQGTAVYGSRILSLSYGLCELFNGTASNVAYNNLWQTAASAGIAVFVATGDAGSPTCDAGGDSGGVPYEAQFGLAVSGLASTPYNTAVGGTDFSWCKPSFTSGGVFQGCAASNASSYWNTGNSSQQSSAKGYVPETPWNDSCLNPIWATYFQSIAPLFKYAVPSNAEGVCNFIYQDWSAVNTKNQQAGGGQFVMAPWIDSVGGSGGASGCVVNSTSNSIGSCNAGATSTGSSYGNLTLVNDGWPKPGWQSAATSLGVPSDGVRDIPDVSFFAGNGSLDSATLICVSNDGASCTNTGATGTGAAGGAEEVGGTSVATPEMAGVMALINQKATVTQGNPNSELYRLAANQTYSSCSAESGTASSSCYFNDIDQGTIATPCDYQGKAQEGGAVFNGSTGLWQFVSTTTGQASPNCSIVNSGDVVGTLSGYGAATGYDLATGLGSLNVANVVNAWTTLPGTGTATVTATPSATSITASQSLTVSAKVAGSNGVTPAGTVTLTSGSYSSGAQTLSNGAYTFNVPAFKLSSGSDTLTVTYSGDNNYAQASGTASVTVSQVAPGVITVAPGALTILPTASLTVTGAVIGAPAGPAPTGTVVLTAGTYTSPAAALDTNGVYSITIPANTLTTTGSPYTLTVTYSGDGFYTAGTPGTANVTVSNTAKASPTVTVNSNSPVPFNASLTVTGTVTGTAGTPTGTVTLTSSVLSGGPYAATLSSGGFSIAIPTNSFQSTGHIALTATYTPDVASSTIYESGLGTGTVNLTQVAPGITVSPAPSTIAVNAGLTVTGFVSGPSGSPAPTGSVTLTSGTYASAKTTLTSSANGGAYSIAIPANSLPVGTPTVTVTYSGDTYYLTSANTATVTVTKLPASVTVTPASNGIYTGQTLQVTASVAGAGVTPTGTVTLSSGTYTSAGQALVSGSFAFTVPANTLSAGTDALTVTYSGDNNYASGAAGTASVTVSPSAFILSSSATTAINRGSLASSTITVVSTSNYSNTVTLACTLNTGGPSNQTGDAPTCTIPSTPIAVGATSKATVTTVAATTGALVRPEFHPNRTALAGLGLAALALLGLLGIPAQRRALRSLLGVFVLILTLGSLAACGGGGGSSGGGGGGGTSNPGTASGTYTFTVKGTGSDPSNLTATTTFTVTVN